MSSTSYPLPLNTSARSTTLPVKSKHHSHRHHHHHSRDKSIPQSAVQLSTNPFSDILSPILSKASSRGDSPQHSRSSIVLAQESRAKEEAEKQKQEAKWKVVEAKREKRKVVDKDLRNSLQALSKLATETTRRLDYTYYSLLSHISSLTSTISALRELSTATSTLNNSFSTESAHLSREISAQISGFGSFDAQTNHVKSLEERMRMGRKKVEDLGQRLEGVRSKVQRYERQEEEWRARTIMRLRMLWGVIGTFLGLFLLLLVVRHWPGGIMDIEGEKPVVKLENTVVDFPEGSITLPSVMSLGLGREQTAVVRSAHTADAEPSKAVDDHPALRLLDEL